MWNSFELHIPLNGCKGTNFSAIFQTFPHFSYKNCKKSHSHCHSDGHHPLNSEALKQSEGRLNSCEAALNPLPRGSKCVQLNHILIQKMSE